MAPGSSRVFASRLLRGGQKVFRLFSLLVLAFSTLTVLAEESVRAEAINGEYIIKYSNTATSRQRSLSAKYLGFDEIKDFPITGARLVRSRNRSGINHQHIKHLLSLGLIEYIEPNQKVSTLDTAANDPSYSQLWGLNNEAQTGGTANIDIDAERAWDIQTGSNNIVVGVVDTGIDYLHPDLAANMWVNPNEIPDNGIDDDGNGVIDDIHGYNAINNSGSPMDDNGHGTHCAGTIGAKGNNEIGVTGVSWNVKLMGLKFLNGSGSGSTADAISALNYAASMKQAGVNLKVLSNSWGGGGSSVALEEAVQALNDLDVLFVAAAGNSSADNDSTTSYPANIQEDNVISVAAIDHNGNLASFSNYGLNSVHLAAPGVDILSTSLNDGYQTLSGTSMATPHVSGVAALLYANSPTLSASETRARLISTVAPIQSLTNLMQAPGTVSAYNALTNTQNELPPPPVLASYNQLNVDSTFDANLGTRVSQGDDDYVAIDLEFFFPYFNQYYNRIAVSTNGRIVPLEEDEPNPTQRDYSNNTGRAIMPYHDDLYPATRHNGEEAGVWVKSSSEAVTVTWVSVNYVNRNSDSPESTIKFQAVIRSSGNIEFNYEDVLTSKDAFDYAASATVGLSPKEGVAGEKVTVSHNEAKSDVINNNKGIRFTPSGKVKNDFDGDGKSDIVVFRPSFGLWFILYSSKDFDPEHQKYFQFGLPSDIPLPADYDGDGKTDLGIYRPEYGYWIYAKSSTEYAENIYQQWGLQDDTPAPGDYDGDGKADLAVYRKSSGTFYTLYSGNADARAGAASTSIKLGGLGHDVVGGDFNGNGKTDYVTVWQAVRYWSGKNDSGELFMSAPWGAPQDKVIACDYDNDGVSDRVVVRDGDSASLNWFVAGSTGQVFNISFGENGATPSCDKDFDGDGFEDLAAYNTNTGNWTIRFSSTAEVKVINWGIPGDLSF